MANLEHGAAIYNQAADLIERTERELADSRRSLISMGLDPEKVFSIIESQIGPEQRREAETAFQQDMEYIDREIEQTRLQLQVHSANARFPRPTRDMV